jgi:hypothetical protein
MNEKTFPANQPSPYNQMVAWEHDCDEQNNRIMNSMFNMILRDGTRSNNDFTWDGVE